MLESIFDKVAGLQLYCEYCKIFKTSFFHKTPPVAASENCVNFPGTTVWLVPTAAFIVLGDKIWSPQVHRPKFVARPFPPLARIQF